MALCLWHVTAAFSLFAQDGVSVDHATKLRPKPVGTTVKYRGKDSTAFTVPPGVPIQVTVTGSNSALYTCAVSTKAVPVGESDSLRAWLGTLKDYLPLLLAAVTPEPAFKAMFVKDFGAQDTVEAETEPLRRALEALDGVTIGPSGMTSVQDSLLLGLDRLSRIKLGGAVRPTTLAIRAGLGGKDSIARYHRCDEGKCTDESFPSALIGATAQVRAQVRTLRAALVADSAKVRATKDTLGGVTTRAAKAAKDAADETRPVQHRAKAALAKALADSVATYTQRVARLDDIQARRLGAITVGDQAVAEQGKRLDAAYALERFSRVVLEASETLECDPVTVARDTGRAVTVAIVGRKLTEITRLPLEDSVGIDFSLAPKRSIGIGMGLSLLWARNALYPTFSTAKLGEAQKDTVKVIRSGQQDRRFDYGLTLGLTWGGLDHRDDGDWAVWLPELTVNPADGVRSLGVGLGFSYSVVKVGLGLLWAKHDEPDPSNPEGSILPNADAFKTVSKLGPKKLYISVSLIGLPPFIRKG